VGDLDGRGRCSCFFTSFEERLLLLFYYLTSVCSAFRTVDGCQGLFLFF